MLLGERNQQNSWPQKVLALYLYATGASRQNISVTAHCGLSASYTTIAGSKKAAKSLLQTTSGAKLNESPRGEEGGEEVDSEDEGDSDSSVESDTPEVADVSLRAISQALQYCVELHTLF